MSTTSIKSNSLSLTEVKFEDVPRQYLKYPAPDSCKILQLPDGRHISYGEYGSQLPSAHPFIFIHGIPDTRLDACLTPSDQKLAARLNIRWIGIDRPGIGFSTLHPSGTVLGWVEDLKCLIQHLNLQHYRIFSVSGGTGWALACAKLLPKEQLLSVGIGFGVAPREAGMQGLSVLNRIGLWIWTHHAWIFERSFNHSIVPIVHQEEVQPTRELIQKQIRWMSREDQKVLQDEDNFEGFVKIYREIYRQGSARGYIEDSMRSTNDWGFKLEDIDYSGIRMWYGMNDVNTPPQCGRYMATRLSNSRLKEYEGKTHFTMWDHIEEMLEDMLQEA